MTENDKWDFINKLDEKLLQGGVILSEWTTFLAKDAELAFCRGANLSAILACQAAIESHLRFDYFKMIDTKGWVFYQLIEKSSLDNILKFELHELRKYRNKWVHVEKPDSDSDLLEKPEYIEVELLDVAKKSINIMLKTLYNSPFV